MERYNYIDTGTYYAPDVDAGSLPENPEYAEALPQSRETAWMLSVIAFGATIDEQNGIVEFKGKRIREFIQSEAAREKLEKTLQTPGVRIDANGKEKLIFQPSSKVFTCLKDMNKESWSRIIRDQHGWAIEDEEFRWGLIGGIFDIKGKVYDQDKVDKKETGNIWINLYSSTNNTAVDLLQHLLESNGVENIARKHVVEQQQRRISGLKISHFKDRVTFAQHIATSRADLQAGLARVLEKEQEQKLQSEIKELGLIPSEDAAWMLGLISGAGHVFNMGLEFTTHHEALLEKFVKIGEKVFSLNAITLPRNERQDGTTSYESSFYSQQISTSLGIFKDTQWIETIQEKHGWVLRDEPMLWKFIEGIFETKGYVKRHFINFQVSTAEEAEFIRFVLDLVDVPSSVVRGKKSDLIIGTLVYGIDNVRNVCQNITSVIPAKQDKIEGARTQYRLKNTPESLDELIEEGLTLIEEYGTLPYAGTIRQLRRENKIKFSESVYRRRLGGSIPEARKRLLQIYQQRRND